NRKPDAGYWQQDVHYTIEAQINEKSKIVEASEKLVYTNNSPFELPFVYFHLYQNAFVKGSYLADLHKANKQPITYFGKYAQQGLGTLVENVQVNGKPCKVEFDNTIMKVYLPKPLAPGASIEFSMNFATFFESGQFRRRMNAYNSYGFTHFNGVHWYPRICVYDKKKGWDVDQHLNKELYGDYGLFDVKLTFSDNYVVEATGALQNPSETYPGDLRAKLDASNFKNKAWNEAPSVITPYDSSKRKTWHYIANNVHDFAFTADPAYRIDETFYAPDGEQGRKIQCIGLVLEPHASKWQTSAEYVAKIIQTFSEDFGMYEYPKMVAADANDGMEYPMLTLDGGGEPDYHGLLVHEIGHNWFYGMIGNNETYRAALDEGFTQFITAWGLTKIDGETPISSPIKNKYVRNHKEVGNNRDLSVYNRYMNDAVRENDKALNTHSNDFHSALGHENGYSNVYHKTATMLYNLQYVLGDSLFQGAMKHYVAKWKFAHPYFEDFRQSIIEFTQQDLNWFFDQWLETTKSIDYGIVSIKKTLVNDEFKIKFKRYGQMQMPLDFRVTAKNGKQYNYHIPNSIFIKKTSNKVLPKWYGWDLLHPTYTAKLNIPSGVKLVELDPSYRLADIDMMDNYKRPNQKLAQESRTVKLQSFIYNAPSWKKYQSFLQPDIWWNAVDGVKAGINFNGSYMNYLRKLYVTVWFNTRLGTDLQYRPFEGESWWQNVAPIDYTLRYETPFKQVSKNIAWGIHSRHMEGFAKHRVFGSLKLNGNDKITTSLTTLYRKVNGKDYYLFNADEWSSYSGGKTSNTQKNSFLEIEYTHPYVRRGQGLLSLKARAPFTYNYSYFEGEWIHKNSWKKLDMSYRAFARYGMGKDIPKESALYLQGQNPEQAMENKFTRSVGVMPSTWGNFSQQNFNHLHGGGGLNLRGYTGYYAIEQDAQGNKYVNYKGLSGAAINAEIEFDRLVTFKPKYLKNYLHLDLYAFGDAGVISRSKFDITNLTQIVPTNGFSKLRMDAGLGAALTIKKFGLFETIPPFTIRFDIPFFVNTPPASKPEYIDFRWVLGISRAF
nr:M1 family metallopeptidase [Chitinophagaceae bacterium]